MFFLFLLIFSPDFSFFIVYFRLFSPLFYSQFKITILDS
jgi:hypothetical protein